VSSQFLVHGEPWGIERFSGLANAQFAHVEGSALVLPCVEAADYFTGARDLKAVRELNRVEKSFGCYLNQAAHLSDLTLFCLKCIKHSRDFALPIERRNANLKRFKHRDVYPAF
jgi:hypothetical protein